MPKKKPQPLPIVPLFLPGKTEPSVMITHEDAISLRQKGIAGRYRTGVRLKFAPDLSAVLPATASLHLTGRALMEGCILGDPRFIEIRNAWRKLQVPVRMIPASDPVWTRITTTHR